MKMDPRYRATIKGYDKSVTIDGMVLYPLTDVDRIAKQVAVAVKRVEDRAYALGHQDAQRHMRAALGIFP